MKGVQHLMVQSISDQGHLRIHQVNVTIQGAEPMGHFNAFRPSLEKVILQILQEYCAEERETMKQCSILAPGDALYDLMDREKIQALPELPGIQVQFDANPSVQVPGPDRIQ